MSSLAPELSRLLDLDHPPVAMTFHAESPAAQPRPAPEPADQLPELVQRLELSRAADAAVSAYAEADIRQNFSAA